MKPPLDWKAFLDQKAVVKFGASIMVNYEAFSMPEFTEKFVLPELAHQIAEGMWRHGYRPIDETGGLWPRAEWTMPEHAAILGTFRAELTARPEQFIAHVQEFIRWQGRTIVARSTWRGFLGWKWQQFKKRFRKALTRADAPPSL